MTHLIWSMMICADQSHWRRTTGKHYFLLLVDDNSQYMWLTLLLRKNEAAEAIKHFKAQGENGSGAKLHVRQTNRGGKFTLVESDSSVQRKVWNTTSRHCTCHNRMAWWSGGIRTLSACCIA